MALDLKQMRSQWVLKVTLTGVQSHCHRELGKTLTDASGEFDCNINILQLQSKKNCGKPGLDQVNA